MSRWSPRRKSLKNRILILGVVGALAYFLLSTTISYLFLSSNVEDVIDTLRDERIHLIENATLHEIRTVAENLSHHLLDFSLLFENISRVIADYSDYVPSLARHPLYHPLIYVPPYGRESDIKNLSSNLINLSSHIQASLLPISHHHLVLNLYFTHTNGVTVFVNKSALEAVKRYVPLDPTTRPWYIKAVELNETVWSEMYIDVITGNYLVTLSLPVWNSTELIGVIGVDLNIRNFIEPLRRIKLAGLEEIFLMNEGGDILASSLFSQPTVSKENIFTRDVSEEEKEIYRRICSERENAVYNVGNKMIFSYPVHPPNWMVAGVLDMDEALTTFTAHINRWRDEVQRIYIINFIFLVGLIFVIFVVLYSYLMKRLFYPLEEIGEAVKKVKDGEYGVKVPVRDERELALLSEAFNEMSQRLKYDMESMERDKREIEDAKKAGELFLDIAAHDVKNLLTGIRLNTELALLKRRSGSEVSEEMLEKIMSITDSATQTLDKIKDLYKIKMYRFPLQRVNVKDLIKKAEELIKRMHPRKIIEFDYHLPEGRMDIPGDEFMVNIFLNLFQNAVRYTPGDYVYIQVKGEEKAEGGQKYWKVSVADKGRGIPPERKKDLFKRFSTWDSISGSGLGLAIVRELVERSGGRIWVEDRHSEDYRKGARFVMLFPRWEERRRNVGKKRSG
ncbi:MAG: sensor histidine kinase [Thermoplasmata archaeon]|nr:sensor histidine kinase [Thermoplasmata archaeon]